MTQHYESHEYEGLKFFGKMNASISHEIRNTLAVINENAGLIKDLIMMSEKGQPLDLGRIGGRVEKVLEQVKRTDRIVDNMNRFAHSVDNPFMKINACEYVEFVIRLSERFANMKGVVLTPELPSESIEITTFPFLFENILYLCLDQAMQHPNEGKTILISVQREGDRVKFEFTGLSSGNEIDKNLITGSPGIFEKLEAGIVCKEGSGSFILDIPAGSGA
jgi:signal transduction histidine kinase